MDSTDPPAVVVNRRSLVLGGVSLGTALLAGCTESADLGGGTDTGDTPTSAPTSTDDDVGTFRLLISDQPVAIDEFDSLEVSFDRARVFRADGEGGADGDDEIDDEDDADRGNGEDGDAEDAGADEGEDENERDRDAETENEGDGEDDETPTLSPSPTATSAENVTATASPSPTANTTATGTASPEAGDETDNRGFLVIDLGGATVDLTEVVGDKAMSVFEGDLPAGRYAKIELYAGDVEGVVDGESVSVMIPSQKLQIVKPFEVAAGETLSFVFDINVVKKGQTGEYNLLPVIAKSGVAGEDVEVDVVGEAAGKGDGDRETDTESDDEGDAADDGTGAGESGQGNGPPENETGGG